MAPRKKAAPQPPPLLPPAESSETRSGSRSRSRSYVSDSDDDEIIAADSPVPAATPTQKNTLAPSHKGGESESSSEEDDDDEEEPVHAPPKNQPLMPPQNNEDSETSDDDGEDGDDDEEEEPTRAAPPSAPEKQPPPQPQEKEDSDTSGDEDEEAPPPPPKRAPEKEAAAEALKPSAAAAETKKPGSFHRIWSPDDDLRIIEALGAHQKQHGTLPQPGALMDVLAGKLDNPSYGTKELQSKVGSLRTRYLNLSKRAELPAKEHDRRLLDLSKMVWDAPAAALANVANAHGRKGFEEMCELYPYLAEEVKELEAARPGMCKRAFGEMDHGKARALDDKIKKHRVLQIKVEMRRANLVKEVTKTLIDLVDR